MKEETVSRGAILVRCCCICRVPLCTTHFSQKHGPGSAIYLEAFAVLQQDVVACDKRASECGNGTLSASLQSAEFIADPGGLIAEPLIKA